MLAYIFWHALENADKRAGYEGRLLRCGEALAREGIPGFIGTASFTTSATPWLGEAGYEDWTWIEGAWALDHLNARAVSGTMAEPHSDVSRMTKHGGFGALYYLVAGAHKIHDHSSVVWLSRPRGIDWREVLPTIAGTASSEIAVWWRQMVLGPSGSTEFAVIGAPDLSLTIPSGWTAFTTERHRLRAAQ